MERRLNERRAVPEPSLKLSREAFSMHQDKENAVNGENPKKRPRLMSKKIIPNINSNKFSSIESIKDSDEDIEESTALDREELLKSLYMDPQSPIVEISKRLSNELKIPYAFDVHMFDLQQECQEVSLRPDFVNMKIIQREITAAHRETLISWLSEVAEVYCLSKQTLCLATNYVDRVLTFKEVSRSVFQLLGVSCLLIASKCEEILPPSIEDFVFITDSSFQRHEILMKEMEILTCLNFTLRITTYTTFLDRLLIVSNVDDRRLVAHVYYMAELSLISQNLTHYLPSLIATSSICLTLHTFGKDPLPVDLANYTQYTTDDILPVVTELYGAYRISHSKNSCGIRRKYRKHRYSLVGDVPPPQTLPFTD